MHHIVCSRGPNSKQGKTTDALNTNLLTYLHTIGYVMLPYAWKLIIIHTLEPNKGAKILTAAGL